MRTSWRSLFVAAALVAACGGVGSVTITSSLKGRTVEVQTAFGVFLLNKYETKGSGVDQKRTLEPRESQDQVLYLSFSGAAFDPNRDLRFLEVEERKQITNDTVLNGQARVIVRRAGFLEANKEVIYDDAASDEPPSTSPTIASSSDFVVFFALPELVDTALPKEIVGLASSRKVTLKLTKIGKRAGEATEGKLTFEWKKAPGDPEGSIEGKLELEFSAEMVGERIGSCNLSLVGGTDTAQVCNELG